MAAAVCLGVVAALVAVLDVAAFTGKTFSYRRVLLDLFASRPRRNCQSVVVSDAVFISPSLPTPSLCAVLILFLTPLLFTRSALGGPPQAQRQRQTPAPIVPSPYAHGPDALRDGTAPGRGACASRGEA